MGQATNTTTPFENNSTSWFLPALFTSLKRAVQKQAPPDRLVALHYFISPYSGVCMLMAIILNRTVVFAGSRRYNPHAPQWPKLLLRLLTMTLTIHNLWNVVLQFAYLYPGVHELLSPVMPEKQQSMDSLLWGVFMALCLSQFLETFVSTTSGESASNDTGLTLFEHSLAFQECQYMTGPSPHILIICCFSLVTQLAAHVMGVLHYKKYQLIPSTVLGISFLIFYCGTIYSGDIDYLPYVVVASLFPQLFVLIVALFCVLLYGLAVLVNGGEASGLTYTPMIKNMRSSLNLQLNDDFNSALMRFGFIMFTAVENTEYVNELSDLTLSRTTYLEKHHLVSGYFNKLDNNPELVDHNTKNSDDTVKLWILAQKVANMGRLIMALFKLVMYSIRKRPMKTNNLDAASQKITTPLASTSAKSSSMTITLLDDDEIDESEDFVPSDELDSQSDSDLDDPLEYDSDAEDLDMAEYVPTLAMARLRDSQLPSQLATPKTKSYPLDELFDPTDLINLITPSDPNELSYLATLRSHLSADKRLTRREYCVMNQDDLLREVIHQSRPHNDHIDIDDRVSCVVCQTEPRSVVLWPCKCFSLCEGCRMSLGVRGFGICVCCRAKVEGYSKVFIP